MLTVENPGRQDWANMSLAAIAAGNAQDTFFTLKCYEVLLQNIQELDMEEFYEKLLQPATEIFAEIEGEGLIIDRQRVDDLDRELKDELLRLEEEIYSMKGVLPQFNLDASEDIIRILYSAERMEDGKWGTDNAFGFGLYPPQKTKKKQSPATNDETLTTLLTQVQDELDKRKLL